MTPEKLHYDAMFSGIIGQDYDMLKLICPLASEMSILVGLAVKEYCVKQQPKAIKVIELGGGTGITTLSILSANDHLTVVSVDNEPTMQQQAQKSLKKWLKEGRLSFCSDDALTALQTLDANSIDIVASAYTLHNFETGYRADVIREIFRILKPGGRFINGDRYALDDISVHTQTIQNEVTGYFKVLAQNNRLDLLEKWIIHLFNDESENHVMRESTSIEQLKCNGFNDVKISNRKEVNALVTASK